jgi:hypothetical protein
MVKLATLLAATAVLLVGPSLAPATMIHEISVDSVDTAYAYNAAVPTDSMLSVAQSGVTIVLEHPGNVQDELADADFSFVTYLSADRSAGGRALGDFAGGAIRITNSLGELLLAANVDRFTLEESTALPFCVLAGAGNFNVTGGSWANDFGPSGVTLELTWKFDQDINSFKEGFQAESDVTLTPTPEPATMGLIGLGALGTVLRRRHR